MEGALPISVGLFQPVTPKWDRPAGMWPAGGVSIGLWVDGLAGWIEQAVQVDDDIAHLCVIHGALCSGAPGGFRGGIIGKDADQIDTAEIVENQLLRILDASAHHKVQ